MPVCLTLLRNHEKCYAVDFHALSRHVYLDISRHINFFEGGSIINSFEKLKTALIILRYIH